MTPETKPKGPAQTPPDSTTHRACYSEEYGWYVRRGSWKHGFSVSGYMPHDDAAQIANELNERDGIAHREKLWGH
jgi:hypothetical protein